MKIFKLSRDFPSSQIQGLYSTRWNVRWNIFAEWYHRGRQPPHNAPPNTRWPKSPSYHGYPPCNRPGFTFYGCLPFIHGQTGRSSVWPNRTQNSGPVNFVPESLLPFVHISSIYRKTTAKAWNWYQRWLWWLPSGKTGLTFSHVPLLPEISAGTTQKGVLHLLSNRIFWKLL